MGSSHRNEMQEIVANLRHLMHHSDQISEEGFRELINKIVAPLGSIGWEFGPDPEDSKRMILSFACKANRDELALRARQLRLPIKEKKWSIVAGIPPRDWEKYFEIVRDSGRRVKVEAGTWYWHSSSKALPKVLNLAIPEGLRLNDDLLREAVFIFLTGELGEGNFAKFVQLGEVSRFSGRPPSTFQSINTLRKQFVQWAPNAEYGRFLRARSRE